MPFRCVQILYYYWLVILYAVSFDKFGMFKVLSETERNCCENHAVLYVHKLTLRSSSIIIDGLSLPG